MVCVFIGSNNTPVRFSAGMELCRKAFGGTLVITAICRVFFGGKGMFGNLLLDCTKTITEAKATRNTALFKRKIRDTATAVRHAESIQ